MISLMTTPARPAAGQRTRRRMTGQSFEVMIVRPSRPYLYCQCGGMIFVTTLCLCRYNVMRNPGKKSAKNSAHRTVDYRPVIKEILNQKFKPRKTPSTRKEKELNRKARSPVG